MKRSVTWLAGAVAAVLAATLAAPMAQATTTATTPSLSYVPSASWWGTNGRVNDIKVVGGRVYLAGGFDYIGRTTGYAATVTSAAGALGVVPMPVVDGVVRAAVPDGAGGWFMGGDFSRVGTVTRKGLAHIWPNGSLDPKWRPKVKGGGVYALVLTPSGLVVGGDFTSVNKAQALRLAKVDAGTGALVPGWQASANGSVRALAATGDQVYAGGDFTILSGSSRGHLGRLDAATGTVDQAFAGQAGGTVRALAVDPANGVVYAGGDFATASGGSGDVARQGLAAWAAAGGALAAYAPGTNGSVQALAVTPGGGVAVGGLFTTIGGVARAYLALTTASGAVTAFDAALDQCNARHTTKYAHGLVPCTPEVSALSVDGTSLFVGGRFGRSRGVERHDAAGFDLSTGGLTAWNPVAGDRPLAVAASPGGGGVLLGGEFTSVGGLVRKGVAALDATTGAGVPGFRADADGFVEAMIASTDGSRLYLGGSFAQVQGQARSRVASIVTATGLLDPSFHPSANDDVTTLAYTNGSLYVGGKFTKVDGVVRSHAVRVGGLTGVVDPAWVADTTGPPGPLQAGGMVQGLEVTPNGSTVFLAGPFTTVNGASVQGGIAVVSGATGQLGPRQLGGVRGCSGLGPWINRLYLSDDGTRLYGGDVCPDYVYQWDAVNLSSPTNPTGLRWRTQCNGGMQGRLEVNGHFYYGTHGGDKGSGGWCAAYPGGPAVPQQRYFVFDTSGWLFKDAPTFDSPMGVWSFGATSGGLLVGGDFTIAGTKNNVQQGLAFFPGTP
jgi:hypothetical protein